MNQCIIPREKANTETISIGRYRTLNQGKIRMAIIGAGLWGEAHAGIYQHHPGTELVAVCDLNLDKA